MNRTISFKTAVALASVTVFAAIPSAFAQDEAAQEKSAETKEVAEQESAKKAPENAFRQLLRCVRAEGTVQLLKPRTKNWVNVEEGRYYPLGSTIRTLNEGGAIKAEFEFGTDSKVLVTSPAEFKTREIEIGEKARVLELKAGRVDVSLPRNLGEGLFKVVAPAFACENMAGDSWFDYQATGDGDEVVVRCVTGTMFLKGAHYQIQRMAAANQIRIRTTGDQLFTSLRGESGDSKVALDQGIMAEKNFETGETKDVVKTLDFVLTPQCSVKIFRAKSASGRMSVSTMTFNPSGEMLNRFAFAEGLSNVNSGELVISRKVVDEKIVDDEETETVDASSAAKDEAKAEEKKSEDSDSEASQDDEKKGDEEKKDEEDI